jgi:hypothetical protein
VAFFHGSFSKRILGDSKWLNLGRSSNATRRIGFRHESRSEFKAI